MYDYRPPRKGRTAHTLILALLCLTAACFVTAARVAPLRVIFQSLGLLLLLPAIQLVTRFIATRYLYRVRVGERGTPDLEIYAYRGGAQMKLVCRVALADITAAAPLTKEKRRAPRGTRRYSYCMDMSPRTALILSVTNADGACEVLLQPDATLAELLTPRPKE
jgi:hypothetical protein